MLIKQATFTEDRVKLTFAMPVPPDGRTIAVAGDFNDWEPKAMRRERDLMQFSVVVPTGRRYAFRYYADGQDFFNDDGADGFTPNPFGSMNSVADLTSTGW
jgi:1,4-alpha-glucan branching enzyme